MQLTERDLQIVALVAAGMTNKEIAAKLGVTRSTVKTHLERMASRLKIQGQDSRVSLVMFALRNGLIK
jgi:DNA-binding NarL/FixJ family response regulator